MKHIDLNTWERAEIYRFFSGVSNPFYSVTFSLDVTELYRFSKDKGVSFYYALVYLCTKAVNKTEAFRFSFGNGEPVMLEKRLPSFTDIKKGSELFYIVTMPCEGDILSFCKAARDKSAAQTEFIDNGTESEELIYFSCLPWVELTALTNERDFDRDDSVPRIAWGKYTEEGGKKKLCVSLEVNHRFIDGVHIGKFYNELKKAIAEL